MSSGVMMCGYMGDIYLDIPYDKDLPLHQELEAYLQYSDDRMRFDNVMFLYMPLDVASRMIASIQNAIRSSWPEPSCKS